MNTQRMLKTLGHTLLFGALCAAQPSAWAESLVDAVSHTLTTHPQIHLDTNRKQSLQQQVEIARGGYYPKMDLNLGYGYEWSENTGTAPGDTDMTRREAGIRASQMLYDGYATKSAVDAAEAGARAGDRSLTATSEATALRVAQVYLDVLRQQYLLQLTRDNHAAHQQTYDRIKQRSESGMGSLADLQQASARLALANSNLITAEGNLWEAEIRYERVVGHKPVDLQMPTDKCCTHLPASAEDAVTLALQEHPALLAAYNRHEAALAEVNGAKAAFHPQLDLELGANRNNNVDGVEGRNNDAYAMLRARYNAYRGGADTARVAQLEHLSEAEREAARQLQWEVEADARSSWDRLNNLLQRLPQLERHSKAAGETRTAYQRQFDIGQRSLLDLLDSENEYFTAQSDRTHGEFDEWYARYRLLAHVGKLLEALEVKPDFDTIRQP